MPKFIYRSQYKKNITIIYKYYITEAFDYLLSFLYCAFTNIYLIKFNFLEKKSPTLLWYLSWVSTLPLSRPSFTTFTSHHCLPHAEPSLLTSIFLWSPLNPFLFCCFHSLSLSLLTFSPQTQTQCWVLWSLVLFDPVQRPDLTRIIVRVIVFLWRVFFSIFCFSQVGILVKFPTTCIRA